VHQSFKILPRGIPGSQAMSILAVLSDDVVERASSIFPIKRFWPSDGMRGTSHMVRAVRFARWLGGGSARPRGAKPSFHVSFPSPPLWRTRGRRCVATAASPPGTGSCCAGHGGAPPCHGERGAGASTPASSILPFSYSPPNPSRRRRYSSDLG
jgi:hypothetical protein